MPERPSSARTAAKQPSVTVDVVLFTPHGGELAVLVLTADATTRAKSRATLPSDGLRGDESLDDAALRIARDVGLVPSYLDQARALGGARRDDGGVSITYFGLVPDGTRVKRGATWVTRADFSALDRRHRDGVDTALAALRAHVDQQPIAFKLLPPAFTLSELQSVYELLLGRRLHKASFRRSLHAAALVEPTEEWRGEGRGRPAQLFRYASPRRKRQRRGIRFDLLA